MSGTTTTTTNVQLTPIFQKLSADMAARAQEIAAQPYQTPPSAAFNEAAYLAANPDVAAAVERGDIPSGLAHYQQFGYMEDRQGTPELVAPFSPDQQAAFEAARGVAGQAGDIYGQLATATGQSILPAAIQQTQDIGGALAGFAQQGEQFLPGISTAAQEGARIAGQAEQYTPAQQAALAGAQEIATLGRQPLAGINRAVQAGQALAGRAEQFLPPQEQVLANAQSLAAQSGQYTPALGSALTASQGLTAQAQPFLAGQQVASSGAQGLAGQGQQVLPSLQQAAQQTAALAGQAGQYLPVQQNVLANAQQIAAQTGQYAPAFTSALGAAQGISEQANQFLPMQAGAAQAAQNIAGQAGGITPLGQLAALSGQGIAGVGTGMLPATLSGTMGLAQAFPGVNIGAYMNPYTEAVLQPALEDLAERAQIQQNALNSRAAMTGSFGGSRNALAQQQFERDLLRETGRLSAQERARAFDVGAQQFRQDQTMLPALYNQAFGQLASAQGLQRGASDLGTAALGQLTQSQGLQRGVSDLGAQAISGLQAAQGMQRTNAELAQAGLGGLQTSLGIERTVSDLGMRGLESLSGAQGLQTAAGEAGIRNLTGITNAQNLFANLANINQTGLAGVQTAQGMEEANARLAQAGLSGLGSAMLLERGVGDIATQGISNIQAAQGLQQTAAGLGGTELENIRRAQDLYSNIANIGSTGLSGLGAAQGLQRGASDLNVAGLGGLAAMQGLTAAPSTMLTLGSDFENRRLAQLAGLGAANASLLGTQVNPLLATGGMQQGLETERMNRMDALAAQQQNFPLRGFEVLRNALGMNTGQTTTATTQAPKPNATATTVGTIAAGIGALPALFSGASSLYGMGQDAYNWLGGGLGSNASPIGEVFGGAGLAK